PTRRSSDLDASLITRIRHVADGKSPNFPGKTREESARVAALAEQAGLLKADLFFIDAPMIEVAEAAAETLPAFQVDWQDIPCPEGLIYFAKPITVLDEERNEILISAAKIGRASCRQRV